MKVNKNIKNIHPNDKNINIVLKQNNNVDDFTVNILKLYLDLHIENTLKLEKIKKLIPLTSKKIRYPNFPECISENIVKFIYQYFLELFLLKILFYLIFLS